MNPRTTERPDDGVANLIEYIAISGILMVLMVIMVLQVNSTFIQGPADQLSYAAFTDIGNGVSTRIIDIYVISPREGNITSLFDIPDEVAQKDYFVEIGSIPGSTGETVVVSRDYVTSSTSLSGIGATKGVRGNTTGRGINKITYDSSGV